MSNDDGFDHGTAHVHQQTIPTLLYVTTILVILLGAAILGLGLYLSHRADIADQRAANDRQGVCAVLDRIPPGHDPGIDTARHDFTCGPATPTPGHTPQPAKTSTPPARTGPATASAPVVTSHPVGPTHIPRAPVVAPPPTRTPRPAPRPTVTRTRTATPRPSPSGLCLLGVLLC